MSPNPNKTSALGVIIILVTACSISISAQTPAAVNGLTAKPDLIRETKETALKKKSVPLAEGTDPTTGPAAASEVSPRTQGSDLVRVNANTKVAAGDEGREAIRKAPPASRKAPPVSPQTSSSDEWQFQVSPYFWLASLHGTGGVGNRTTQVDESFSDIFHSLDFALMGLFEARKGKLFVLTDLEYVAISDDKATPGPLFSAVNAKFKTFIFDPEVGYRIYDDPDKGASVDVLGGIRVWHVSTDLAFSAGILPAIEVQGSRNWVDAVGGLRGKAPLSQKIFLTGKFDLGGGGSKFTYQLFGGAGYGINEKVALIFGYRVLDVNYNKNNFVYDMNQRGPIVGLGFKF